MAKDESQLIYEFLLLNELYTQRELDIACSVGGFNIETLNYLVYRETSYHDIEQLWQCERKTYSFNNEIIKKLGLE